jgi:nitrate/nitrite-specific signal transduction histidine kinase
MRWGIASRSLRTKIIAWSFVPTVIILAAVGWYIFYAYQQTTSQLVINQSRELTQVKAQQASTIMSEAANPPISSLLFSSNLANQARESQMIKIMQSRSQLALFDGGIVVLDGQGTVVITDPQRMEILGQDWSGRSYIRKALEYTGKYYISNVLPDGPGGAPVIALAMALQSNSGEVDSVVVFMLRVGAGYNLQKLLDGQNLGPNVFIVDGNGTIVYDSDLVRFGADLSRNTVVQRALAGSLGSMRSRNDAGRQLIASYAPAVSDDWRLISEQDWVDMVRPVMGYSQLLILLLSLGVIVPVIVVSVGVRRITKPIDDLIDAAQSVADGNFERKVTAQTGDELEELAEQFNRMSARLRESYSLLEKRVGDRTRELAVLNAVSAVVNQSLDLEAVLQAALGKTLEVMNLTAGAAYRLDPDGEWLTVLCHRGLSEELIQNSARLSLAENLPASMGHIPDVFVRQVDDYPEGKLRDLIEKEDIRAVINIPLVFKGSLKGAMVLGQHTDIVLKPEEVALLRAIGQQVGVAMENARLFEQAEESAVAAERNRLARELHDAVTQTLFSTSLIAEVLPDLWAMDVEEAKQSTEELRQLTRGALAEMRTLLLELRPATLTQSRFEDLLKQLSEAVIGRARLPVNLSVEGDCRLPPEVQVVLYRIAQESLNNIVKYARATQVNISLIISCSSLHMEINDNGIGFNRNEIKPTSLGMRIMRERAQNIGADFEVLSQPGKGTTVSVTWKNHEQADEEDIEKREAKETA